MQKIHCTDGLTFRAENRFYKKLVSSVEFDYQYWEAKCKGKLILFISNIKIKSSGSVCIYVCMYISFYIFYLWRYV